MVNGSTQLRKRYITRAKWLLGQRTFGARLAERRTDWDAAHPDARLGRMGKIEPVPSPLPDLYRGWCVLPTSVHNGLQHWLERARDAPTERRREAAWHERRWRRIADEWHGLALAECRHWWPEDDFPNYLGAFDHPALLFLTCCMAFDETSAVPAALIDIKTPKPAWHPHNPFDDSANPRVAELETIVELLKDSVRRALAGDEDRINREINRAMILGARAAIAKGGGATLRPGVGGYHFVPLWPGMTSSDWDQMGPLVTDTIRRVYGGKPEDERAVELRRFGRSPKEIANQLGISPTKVREALRAAGCDTREG